MTLERIVEIFDSYGVINVKYKNNPVWIEDINKDTLTAHVKRLETNETKEVPINELIEG